jgi:hypothetical protein
MCIDVHIAARATDLRNEPNPRWRETDGGWHTSAVLLSGCHARAALTGRLGAMRLDSKGKK